MQSTSPHYAGNGRIDVDGVKSAARGRWREVLTAFGFDGDDQWQAS